MKKTLLSYFIFLFTLSSISLNYAQNTFDLNGSFEGYRELKIDASDTTQSFLYQYNLTQEGTTVTGTSIVYNAKGDYAEVQIHGVIVDNKLYFEEYGTIDQINPTNDDWCYESGHLDIKSKDGKLILSGNIKSFSKNYGFFCSESYAILEKSILETTSSFEDSNSDILAVSNVYVAPNPTENIAIVSFTLMESSYALIEVYDLEGELILKPLNRNLLAGEYSFELDLSFQDEGMYIVELILDRKIYSTELYKSKL